MWAMFEVPEKPVDCIIADLRGENESLRGALQAALTRVDAAIDALVPPGARVEEAQGLLEGALTILSEELDDVPETAA